MSDGCIKMGCDAIAKVGRKCGVSVRILVGDCLERLRGLPSESVHCVVTSASLLGFADPTRATPA